jgi:non-lysosomal glucosylceramidase
MADAMIGFFLCDLAGLHELNDRIGRERIVSHLRVVLDNNVTQYHEGRYGALLVAAPGQTRFSGDGGDELQVNEVLVGSTWMLAAMLAHYGLTDDAVKLTESLRIRSTVLTATASGCNFEPPPRLMETDDLGHR